MNKNFRLLLIYTGGTIGMAKESASGALRPFEFDKLLELIPEIQLIPATIDYFSFDTPVDSSNLKPKNWVEIGEVINQHYAMYDGFVVLHGTDTMAYTASAVSFMFSGLKKPIIFTGSQLPIGDLRTDAKENLISSLEYASMRKGNNAVIQEVCIYFEYKLFRANRTTKVSAAHFNAFESPNYPILGESGVDLKLKQNLLWREDSKNFTFEPNLNADIALIKLYPGLQAHTLPDLGQTNTKILLLETFGTGNVMDYPAFRTYLQTTKNQGIDLVALTQCVRGRVNLGRYTSSQFLVELDAISGADLTTEAALTKAMHLLGLGLKGAEFKREFQQNLRGEISN